MFLDTSLQTRIASWRKFRIQLEVSKDPFQDTINLWDTAPRIDRYLEPWDSQHWPTPWELLKENRFCPIAIPLMMGWTLKLTDRFKQSNVLIKICIDHSVQRYYNVLYIDSMVLNYEHKPVDASTLPESLIVQYSKELF
jgi:hypothetical protein